MTYIKEKEEQKWALRSDYSNQIAYACYVKERRNMNDINKCRNLGFILLVLFIFSLAGCSNTRLAEDLKDNEPTNLVTGEAEPTVTVTKPMLNEPTVTKQVEALPQEQKEEAIEEQDLIRDKMNDMTLEDKIGQLVIVGLEGHSVDENTKALIGDYHVGGFILFHRNIESVNQLLTLLNDLKTTNQGNNIPLFLSVDEEGGRVSRMPEEFIRLPSNQKIGEVNSGDLSYKIGAILSRELKELGFNVDFAPVLDINSNPDNPVIGDRSFGSDETIVSELGIQTLKGITDHGVIAVVKHFPGHGDTSEDSHLSLPLVNNDLKRLEKFELVPFKKAVEANVDAVMVAHILLRQVDSKVPASMSKIVITDLLRTRLGFEGVIVSDDMTMGAIVENYNLTDAVIKSVNAGCDLLLVCHGYDQEIAVLDALKRAVLDGTITESRIDESVYRILKLKEKYRLTDHIISSVDIDSINQEILQVLDTYIKD